MRHSLSALLLSVPANTELIINSTRVLIKPKRLNMGQLSSMISTMAGPAMKKRQSWSIKFGG